MDSSVDLLCFIADFLYLFSDNLHYEKFQDGTVKCIEDEIPFELPEGWCWSRLVSLTAIITKGASPKWQGVDYTSSGIMFITSENVGVETLLLESPKFLPEKINEIQPRSILETHDILTNIVGASIGRTCEYTLVDSANTNQAVAIIRLIAIDMVSYVVKCLNSDYCVNLMFANQVNVARANLSLSSLANFLIPIPPLKEMYRIIAHLDCSLRHISGIQSSEDELRQLILFTKTKILDLAIRGKLVPQDPNDEPASVLLERIRAEKEELIKQGKIKRDKKESVIFKGEDNSYYGIHLPDGWDWASLREIALSISDGSHNPPPDNGSGIPLLSAVNINDNSILMNEISRWITNEEWKIENQRTNIEVGDVLLTIVGSIGRSAVVQNSNHFALQRSVAVIKPCLINPLYLMHIVQSPQIQKWLTDNSKGTAQKGIYLNALSLMIIPIPPLAEQARIVEQIHIAYKQLDLISNALL